MFEVTRIQSAIEQAARLAWVARTIEHKVRRIWLLWKREL
jgi:hypothetical protein